MIEIKPVYVTFEQAKLLKEKGFDELCNVHYTYGDGDINPPKDNALHKGGFIDADCNPRPYKNSELVKWQLPYGEFSAPEQWQVIEWLRLKYGIWIEIALFDIGWLERGEMCFQWRVYDNSEDWETNTVEYKTPQETYSAAFDYVLNNLI